MTDGPRLALRLPWMAGEPAHGYLFRVAARYRVAPGSLASRMGLDWRGLTRGADVARLAEMAGIDVDGLADISPVVRARDRRVDLAGESILLSDWSMATRRWCAACLAADLRAGEFGPHHRYWWDVRSIMTCPSHGIAIRDTCGTCGDHTTWRDPSPFRCRCGGLLTILPGSEVEPIGGFSSHVAARLRVPGCGMVHDAAGEVPLFHLPKLAQRLGMALAGVWAPSPPEIEASRLEGVRTDGIAAIRDPRAGFIAALDRTISGRSERTAGLMGAYGWVYSHWLAFPDQDGTGLFAPLLREHAVANDVISIEEPVLGAADGGSLSLTGLADRLGYGFERTRRMAAEVGVIGAATRRGVACPVSNEAAERLSNAVPDGMTVREVCATLGVGKRVVGGLGEASLLLRSDAGLFDRREVEGFARRLSRGGHHAGRLVSLTGLARSGAGTVAELCSEVVAGKLMAGPLVPRPIRLDQVGLESTQVAARRSGPPITVRAIARRLGLREDVTAYLSATGVLSGDATRRPSLGGIAMFERDFVTAVELARRAGVSARRVWLALEGMDLRPAFGPPECRQLIYRRTEAETALSAHLSAHMFRPSDQTPLIH